MTPGTQSIQPVETTRAPVAPHRPARRDWIIAACIFTLALTVRLLFLAGSPDRDWPHSAYYEGDAPVWAEWASALDRDESFEFGLPMRTPGMAYTLHWLQPGELAGSFLKFKLLWCVLSALTCAITYLAGGACFSRCAGLIGAIVLSASFGSYVTATSLNNETPYALLLILLLWGTVSAFRRPRFDLVMALGIGHGVAMLFRAEHALLIAMFAVFMVVAPLLRQSDLGAPMRRIMALKSAGAVVIMLVLAVAMCLPWSLHGTRAIRHFNTHVEQPTPYRGVFPSWTQEAKESIESLPAFARPGNMGYFTHLARQDGLARITAADVQRYFDEQFGYVPEPIDDFVLVSIKGPLDFALANHPEAGGGFSRAALDDGFGDDLGLAFGKPSHLKLVNHGYAEGWRTIRDDPGHWSGVVQQKLGRFANGMTLGWTGLDLPYGREGVRRAVDQITPMPGELLWWRVLFVVVVAAGAVMAMAHRVGWPWVLVLLYKLVVTIAFYGYARQAVSIQPVMYLFVGILAAALFGRLEHRWKGARAMVVVIAALLITGAVTIEIIGAALGRPLTGIDPVHPGTVVQPAAQWGPEAFQVDQDIYIRPVPRESP